MEEEEKPFKKYKRRVEATTMKLLVSKDRRERGKGLQEIIVTDSRRSMEFIISKDGGERN